MVQLRRIAARSTLLASVLVVLSAPASATDGAIWAELGKVGTLQAQFDQTQHRKILKVPLKSAGAVRFTRPNSLLWTVTAPSPSLFALDNGVARMEYPDLGIKESIDLSQVPEANQIATSMMVWLKADAAAVERDFTVAYRTNAATLTPRDKKLAGILAEIRLGFVASPWRVGSVVLMEPDGDEIDITFHDVVLDGVAVPNLP